MIALACTPFHSSLIPAAAVGARPLQTMQAKNRKKYTFTFHYKSKKAMLYFFLFFACPVWAGGNRP
ncbi:MAG: hypothetical protein MR299_07305, partial [Bacteroidales bacterium]|nr:hypothetical protein [Bacteroidales bacterium]